MPGLRHDRAAVGRAGRGSGARPLAGGLGGEPWAVSLGSEALGGEVWGRGRGDELAGGPSPDLSEEVARALERVLGRGLVSQSAPRTGADSR